MKTANGINSYPKFFTLIVCNSIVKNNQSIAKYGSMSHSFLRVQNVLYYRFFSEIMAVVIRCRVFQLTMFHCVMFFLNGVAWKGCIIHANNGVCICTFLYVHCIKTKNKMNFNEIHFLHIDVLPFLFILFIDFIVFRYSSIAMIMRFFGGIYDMH